jgi:outer membrane protein assembly factor BamB
VSPSILQPGRRRRRHWPILAAVVVLLAGAAVAAYFKFVKAPGNVSHPNVEFTAPVKHKPVKLGNWPLYGYDAQRTRYLDDPSVKPPYRKLWVFHGRDLIEFQPVLAKSRLFLLKNDGKALAIGTRTGKVKWSRQVGGLAASSPAWSRGHVFLVANASGNAGVASAGAGKVWCIDGITGRVIWTKKLASASESSPLVAGGRVYLGSQDGTIYALDAGSGRIVWRYHAGGPVKAGLALSAGRLFVGDYAGEMYSLRASNGSMIWRTGTSGRSFGRAGNFYGTPAVAFGRVYASNTDGFVYSFAASSGNLAWRQATGGYVYAAPAVATVPGMPPAVFAGSYSGKFYAFDARSGKVLWTRSAGGTISGAASVIGDVVYFSTLSHRSTTGLNARDGHVVWTFQRGSFNPAISDGRRLYIAGYSSLYAFQPLSAVAKAQRKASGQSSHRGRAKSGGSSRSGRG